jgi:hypothetical protein
MDDREERPPEPSIGTRRGKVESRGALQILAAFSNSGFQPQAEELVLMARAK